MKFSRESFPTIDDYAKTRIIKKFLWWPTSFNGGTIRWLESAFILEQVDKINIGVSMDSCYVYRWVGIGFAKSLEG